MKTGTAIHRLGVGVAIFFVAKMLFIAALFTAWLALETHRGRGLCVLDGFDCTAKAAPTNLCASKWGGMCAVPSK